MAEESHVKLHTHVVAGRPVRGIVDLGAELGVDLLVIGAGSHLTLYEHLVGSRRELHHETRALPSARSEVIRRLMREYGLQSKRRFAIEGEHPPQDRIQRWGRAIGEFGRRLIDLDELLRLQRIVIGDARYVRLGLRHDGGFVGEHDRENGMPLPEHISARHEDLASLIEGLVAFDRTAARHLDPVPAAAALAFGFVYVHPFEDGNGRLHRYLIHHVLAERGFNPPGMVFPVSAAILDRIVDYRKILETYSARLLP